MATVFAPIAGKSCRKSNKKKTTDVRYCMSVRFFKRLCLCVCVVFVAAVVGLSLGVKNKEISTVKTVYYVVEETESVGASSSQIALRGGAGYEIADGVAFGVYFSEDEAEQVLGRLQEEYDRVIVYPLSLTFLSAEDSFVYNVLEVVEGWTKVLQNGGAQDTVKEGLQSAAKLLSFQAEKADSSFLRKLSEVLESRLQEKVLYVATLRNFICFGCEQLSLRKEMIRI